MTSLTINLLRHKVCLGCVELLPITDFTPDKLKGDGRCNWCKPCRSAAAARWRSIPENLERGRKNAREWNRRNKARAHDGAALSVDHKHVPGFDALAPEEKGQHVRGLLCSNCNIGLGMFRDNPALLIDASAYLRGDR